MPTHLRLCLLGLCSLALASGGCFNTIIPTGPLQHFKVLHGDTGEPVEDARVFQSSDLAADDESFTDERGVATVRYPGVSEGVTVSKRGFLTSADVHPDDPFAETMTTTVYLFPAPAARVGMIVPNGYRGSFKVRDFGAGTIGPDYRNDPAGPLHGKRLFLTPIDPTEITSLERPPHNLVHSSPVIDIRSTSSGRVVYQVEEARVKVARFADGSPLPQGNAFYWLGADSPLSVDLSGYSTPEDGEVALYLLGFTPGGEAERSELSVYFVGTLREAHEAFREAEAGKGFRPAGQLFNLPQQSSKQEL